MARMYRIAAENTFGIEVIRVKYLIMYNWGGKYEGRGEYLTNVKVASTQVHAKWGFDVDVEVEVLDAINVGSREAPVGALSLLVKYAIQSATTAHSEARPYFIRGDGLIKEVVPTDVGKEMQLWKIDPDVV